MIGHRTVTAELYLQPVTDIFHPVSCISKLRSASRTPRWWFWWWMWPYAP